MVIIAIAPFPSSRIISSENASYAGLSNSPQEQVPAIQSGNLFPVWIKDISVKKAEKVEALQII